MAYKPVGLKYQLQPDFAGLDFMTSQLPIASSSPRLMAHRRLTQRPHSPTASQQTEHYDGNPQPSMTTSTAQQLPLMSQPRAAHPPARPRQADAQTQTWQTSLDMAGTFVPNDIWADLVRQTKERDALKQQVAQLTADLQAATAPVQVNINVVAGSPASSSSVCVSAVTDADQLEDIVVSHTQTEVAQALQSSATDATAATEPVPQPPQSKRRRLHKHPQRPDEVLLPATAAVQDTQAANAAVTVVDETPAVEDTATSSQPTAGHGATTTTRKSKHQGQKLGPVNAKVNNHNKPCCFANLTAPHPGRGNRTVPFNSGCWSVIGTPESTKHKGFGQAWPRPGPTLGMCQPCRVKRKARKAAGTWDDEWDPQELKDAEATE